MNGKGKFRRSLALVLALAMVISITGGTLADDGVTDAYAYNEDVTVNGDVQGQASAYADEGKSASLTVTGEVTNPDTTAVFAQAQDGSVKVQTGDVTAEDANDSLDMNAVGVFTYGDKAEAEVTVGDVKSEDNGANVFNHGGEATMKTGDIEASQRGVEVYAADGTEEETITAEQFAALGLNTAVSVSVWDDGSFTQEVFVAADGTQYRHYVYDDGSEGYRKVVRTAPSGTSDVTTGSITVTNSDESWGQGAYVVTHTDGQTSNLTVNGNVSVTDTNNNGIASSGVEVFSGDGNASATVNGNISVKCDVAEAVRSTAEDGTADVTVNGDISVTADNGNALDVNVNGEGSSKVETGDITVNKTGDGSLNAGWISTNDNGAEITVNTGDITANSEGLQIQNQGGDIQVSTGSIESEEYGLSIGVGAGEHSGTPTSAQVEAINGKTPIDSYQYSDGDGNVHTGETYQISDTQNIVHASDSNGNEEWKAVVYSSAEGSTDVTVSGDITVSNGSENGGAIGVEVRDQNLTVDNKQTSSVDVTGSVNVSSEEEATGVSISNQNSGSDEVTVAKDITVTAGTYGQGAAVFASEGDASLKVGGDVAVTARNASGLSVIASKEGSATAEVGSVTISGTKDESSAAIQVTTMDDGSSAAVTAGNVSGGPMGLTVYNEGGTVKVTTGDVTAENEEINAETRGVQVSSNDRVQYGTITEEEFNQLGLTEPTDTRIWTNSNSGDTTPLRFLKPTAL